MPNTRSRRTILRTLVMASLVVLLATLAVARPWAGRDCPPTAHPEWSVARHWNEALLDAIRRALPAPTVHARNLFHASAAMWDAWAAYDPIAAGVYVTEKHTAPDVAAAREEAISYAAYGVLSRRYLDAVGGDESLSAFADLMDDLCHPIEATTDDGDSPAALGNRIAATVLAATTDDGSNEGGGYAPVGYEPLNPPLVVDGSTIEIVDPNRWQPLQIEHMISQNGIPVVNGVQEAIGPHWGHVTSFALPAGGDDGLPMDPGPPPAFGTPAYRAAAVEVIRLSSQLDPADPTRIDVSPGALGDSPLGTNDGDGHELNPVTGEPYEPMPVRRADFGRAVAEYWADGPRSETPPGHWNVIANAVGDELGNDLRVGGEGPVVDRLEWDVKTYLALNGAVHDAAIAAWGLKGHYDSIRPISMIRYLGSLGQSTDPDDPSYHPDGLPLVDGLIQIVTAETTAPGGRHVALAGHEGEIAVRSWSGTPNDPEREVGGVSWIRAVEWVPYQLPTFVTPSFPGYVSGHSTFSRAAAEVMARMTGSAYFPGGASSHLIEAGSLAFEHGPSADVELVWATYQDAADQAGHSRLWGGIHIEPDDLAGRRVGAACGIAAWARASGHFAGIAPP
ncbi:MAG: vanadium-dependent haloperoxidase [Chloroflexi bacterium]|nr:vanadium-dependent haloperoxidase [Chloroflexota bacterium]